MALEEDVEALGEEVALEDMEALGEEVAHEDVVGKKALGEDVVPDKVQVHSLELMNGSGRALTVVLLALDYYEVVVPTI